MKNFSCPALKNLPRGKKSRAEAVRRVLEAVYPDSECALQFQGDPFQLLVMARLSAQCTDKRVNAVAPALFARFPNAAAMAKGEIGEIESLVKSCGLYHTKAKNIRDMSRILTEEYRGVVPGDKKKLLALPGVGEKIANLMLGDVFGDPHVVADTHCIRISNRLGLAAFADPARVTKELEAILPKETQSAFCHRIVDFGREFCRAASPRCADCPLQKIDLKQKVLPNIIK